GERVVGIVGEAGVADGGDPRIIAQELRHTPGVLHVALHTQGYRLDALQKHEGVERRDHGAHGALIDTADASEEGLVTVVLGVDQAVVGVIRRREHRKTLALLYPGEATAVHDGPAQRGAMAAQELGQRVHHQVRPELEGPYQDGRRHRVVDDERYARAPRHG